MPDPQPPPTTTRYFLDTEFIERPHTIDLISIGLVRDDGRELYAESSEVDWSQASPWVLDNVRPHLTGPVMPRAEIARQVREFAPPAERPEFWGYYADYDWVVFCWLFGTMMDLPDGYPMFCHDLKQWASQLGVDSLPEQADVEHHALADARWNRTAREFLSKVGGAR